MPTDYTPIQVGQIWRQNPNGWRVQVVKVARAISYQPLGRKMTISQSVTDFRKDYTFQPNAAQEEGK